MRDFEEFYGSLLEDFKKDLGELGDAIMSDINNYLFDELDAITRITDGRSDVIDIKSDIELVRVLLGHERAIGFKEELYKMNYRIYGRAYMLLGLRVRILAECEDTWRQRCLSKNIESRPDIISEKIKLIYTISVNQPCRFRNQISYHESRDRIEKLIIFFNIIGNSKQVRRICEIIGRGEGVENEGLSFANSKLKSNMFKEQFSGVKISNEIENIIPAELALLDGDLDVIFDMKFAEKKLLCFENQNSIKNVKSAFKEPSEKQKGPVMIIADSSYSMQEYENTAKSIIFLIANIVKRENRACYLVSFNTLILTYDLNCSKWHNELMKFCLTRFDDGTNFKIAVKRALEHIKNDKNADVLVISDALFNIDDEIKNISNAIKSNGSNLYAIVLGDEKHVALSEVFDKIWSL